MLDKVIGIDPGSRQMGWGIVATNGAKLAHVASGVIHTPLDGPFGERLVVLDEALAEILARYSPTSAAIESTFFAKDAQAAAKLGHARGVALLAICRAGLEYGEYAPTQVKRAIVGKGRADKRQMAHVVKAILQLPSVPPSDAADALALAVMHARRHGIFSAMKRQQKPPKTHTQRPTPGAKRRGNSLG